MILPPMIGVIILKVMKNEETKKLTKAQQEKLDAQTAAYTEYAEALGVDLETLTDDQKQDALAHAEAVKTAPKANIAHAAHANKLVGKFSIGVIDVEMPEVQGKPFFNKDAALIISTFPHLYKSIEHKG